MIRSMTGYGRGECLSHIQKIVVEIKSVNNRYNDVNIRVPRNCLFLEERIRGEMARFASRGKIDVFVSIERYADENSVVNADVSLAEKYCEAVKLICEKTGLPFDLTGNRIARMPDVLSIEKEEADQDKVWNDVLPVLEAAGEQYKSMRIREGERICSVLNERIAFIEDTVKEITKRMPEITKEYGKRLYDKIAEILEDKSIDESRLLTETAIFADKISTDEETDRLCSHIAEFKAMLKSNEPVGRRMDFLIQEMNRETNTIGSKCNDFEVSKKVVDIKAEIEKIREQIQNIE